jgi:hypothetical protein
MEWLMRKLGRGQRLPPQWWNRPAILFLVAIGILGGLALLMDTISPSPSASGRIVVEGGAASGFTFKPEFCVPGSPERDPSEVATLYDDADRGPRFTLWEAQVAIHRAGQDESIERKSQCSVYELSFARKGRTVSGELRLDCRGESFGRVHGEVKFKNCAFSSVTYGS